MLASERIRYIISQLKEKGIINLKTIAKELGTSEATVRRDFDKLEAEGRLKRVTGGASLPDDILRSGKYDSAPFLSPNTANYDSKYRVARRAADFVKDGECIFVDGGTSIAALAQFVETKHITIVTNSGFFVRAMKEPTAELVLIGGTYLTSYAISVGNLSRQALEQFHFDRVFIGCSCLDMEENLAYTSSIDALAIKKAAMKNGEHCYLMLDSSKLNRRGFCKLCSGSDFEYVICDSAPELSSCPENFILV